MRHLSAVLNFCEVAENPVVVLSQRRIRKRLKPKTCHLKTSDLPLFYKGLSQVRDKPIRLYIEFLLLTGLRAKEGSSLQWSNVSANAITIKETKNGDAHIIPITQRTRVILETIKGDASACPHVFTYKESLAFYDEKLCLEGSSNDRNR